MSLNELSLKVTGTVWNTFAAQMETGYTPTLRPHVGRDKGTKEYNKAVAELAFKLEEMGYKVWRGR
jgi:hypothetical protein